ncbi:MAG: glycosyltransferase [Myxococcota bacterium]
MARILQVCNTDFYLLKFLAPLVRALVRAGHEVDCVCEGSSPELIRALPGVRIQAMQFPRAGSPREFAAAIETLRQIIRAGSYDCVDGHNRNGSIVSRVAAWLEATPVNLYTAHGFYFHDDQGRAQREATIALEAALAKITDYTFSQSTEDAELMIGRRLISADRLAIIGNGIDTGRFSPRSDRAALEAELSLQAGRFRIASTGRVVKGKGFVDLLRAFHLLHQERPESELVVIGGNIDQDISPYAQEFLAEVEQRGLKGAVRLTGMTDAVEKYLACTDVFVLASYREGLPRALLEAMSMGLAVAATEIRGCKEAVIDGNSGRLFPPKDVEALAGILRDFGAKPEERARLGAAARARVLERFDERDYVRRQVDGIGRLLNEAAGRRRRVVPRRMLGRGLSLASMAGRLLSSL